MFSKSTVWTSALACIVLQFWQQHQLLTLEHWGDDFPGDNRESMKEIANSKCKTLAIQSFICPMVVLFLAASIEQMKVISLFCQLHLQSWQFTCLDTTHICPMMNRQLDWYGTNIITWYTCYGGKRLNATWRQDPCREFVEAKSFRLCFLSTKMKNGCMSRPRSIKRRGFEAVSQSWRWRLGFLCWDYLLYEVHVMNTFRSGV